MLQENRWKGKFKAGVSLNEKILKDHLHAFDKTPAERKEYLSRYDLTFGLPNGRNIILRVRSRNAYFTKPEIQSRNTLLPRSSSVLIYSKMYGNDRSINR